MADLLLGKNAVLEALKSGRNIDKINIQKTDGSIPDRSGKLLQKPRKRRSRSITATKRSWTRRLIIRV